MDKFKNLAIVAGFGCFIFSVLLSGLYPYLITDARQKEANWEEIAHNVVNEFKELKDQYPATFAKAYPNAGGALSPKDLIGKKLSEGEAAKNDQIWREAYAFSIREGRDIYIAEACWHCHSQYVRPVASEDVRFGPVSRTEQDNNTAQRPVLWGTRRVGPDLTYEGGLRSNDWHVAHFWDPASVSPGSVMPKYRWYFEEGWRVMRRIDPKKAELADLPLETAWSYPGLYASEAEAKTALEGIKKTIDSSLAGEADRLFVEKGVGPNEKGLYLVSYLQWLGTWTGRKAEKEQP